MIILTNQKCAPCEGGTLPMTPDETKTHLSQIKDWNLKEASIEKSLKFKNFKESIEFINKVAELAESEGHHPDIHISYNKVRLALTTHAISGLSINDFILASKINLITS